MNQFCTKKFNYLKPNLKPYFSMTQRLIKPKPLRSKINAAN